MKEAILRIFCCLTAAAFCFGPSLIRAEEAIRLGEANPHYSDILCTACHVDEEDYELRSEDQVGFCNRCHGEGEHIGGHHPLRVVPENIEIPEDWPFLENRLTCLTCHLPGHEEYREIDKFLRDGPYANIAIFCESCHIPNFKTMRNPHVEVNRGRGCNYCHDTKPTQGVDTLETVDFCSNPTVLCLRCHDKEAHPAGYNHLGRVNQEIKGKFGAEVNLYRGDVIVCSTCHNPHLLESENHKLREVISQAQACPGCHDH